MTQSPNGMGGVDGQYAGRFSSAQPAQMPMSPIQWEQYSNPNETWWAHGGGFDPLDSQWPTLYTSSLPSPATFKKPPLVLSDASPGFGYNLGAFPPNLPPCPVIPRPSEFNSSEDGDTSDSTSGDEHAGETGEKADASKADQQKEDSKTKHAASEPSHPGHHGGRRWSLALEGLLILGSSALFSRGNILKKSFFKDLIGRSIGSGMVAGGTEMTTEGIANHHLEWKKIGAAFTIGSLLGGGGRLGLRLAGKPPIVLPPVPPP